MNQSFFDFVTTEIRKFDFPLNVYAELLRLHTGGVDYLHFGLFESATEDVLIAQERSNRWLFNHLPTTSCSVLEIGIGLGATLNRLQQMGFTVHGITPDPAQVSIAKARNQTLTLTTSTFEAFTNPTRYDILLFQESSQYIASPMLWQQTDVLLTASGKVLILDEFKKQGEGGLHARDVFLAEAASRGFQLTEEVDFSRQAAVTVEFLLNAVSQYQAKLLALPGVDQAKLDGLEASLRVYQKNYSNGNYGYFYMAFDRGG